MQTNPGETAREAPAVVRASTKRYSTLLEKSLAPSKDHVFLTWHDLDFSVPLKKKDRPKENLVDLSERMKTLQKFNSAEGNANFTQEQATLDYTIEKQGLARDPRYKQILHGLSGFARPG